MLTKTAPRRKAKPIETMSSGVPLIEFGSPTMIVAFSEGLECYRPTLHGNRLKESEGGITQISLQNLRLIARQIGEQPHAILAGPDTSTLFVFPSGCYLATGFSWGYGGEGPRGLATIAEEFGFGENLYDKILDRPQDHQGVLFCKSPVLPRWWEKKPRQKMAAK